MGCTYTRNGARLVVPVTKQWHNFGFSMSDGSSLRVYICVKKPNKELVMTKIVLLKTQSSV
jgi:hypothetical protein